MQRLMIVLSLLMLAGCMPDFKKKPDKASASASSTPAIASASATPPAASAEPPPVKAEPVGPPPRVGVNGLWQTTDISDTLEAIIRYHGGEPIRLLPKENDTLKGRDIQALILIAGRDILPTAYGETTIHPSVKPVMPGRQRYDFALYREAKASGIPVLGYGLGAQEIWVAEGGKLHQDMVADGQPDHHQIQHSLMIEEPLKHMLEGSERLVVKCNHHQGFRLPVPPTLKVVAWAPPIPEIGAGKIPEAVATTNDKWFCVGTQFLLGENQYSEQLVAALIEAAKLRQK